MSGLTPLDLAGLAGCLLAAFFIFLATEIMGPRVKSPCALNLPARLSLDVASLAFVACAFDIWSGVHVRPGSATVFGAVAFAAAAILVSMVVHSWREAVTRREAAGRHDAHLEDAALIREAVGEAVAEAVPAAIPDVFQKLAAQPDPYTPRSFAPRPAEPGTRSRR